MAKKMENSKEIKTQAGEVIEMKKEIAEEMVTVSAAATEVATKGEIEAAKAADKAAKKAAADEKKAKKAAEKAAKDAPKLQKGKLTEDGKMIINTYVASDGMQVYYIVQEGLKKERLFDATAKVLVEEGKAITINPAEFEQMVADAKAAKKAAAKPEENKEGADA